VRDLGTLLAQLPADARTRGRRFEQLCRWFLLNDPVYAGRLQKVWLWDEWPGRWGADAGIDLVAETTSGDLWAIQAKAYDQQYAVTKADVDTFLSESGRSAFSFRLLIATTDLIGTRAAKTMDGQAIPAGFVGLAQLERSPVLWPGDIAELRSRRLAPKRPLPHSREAIDAVCDGFRRHDRGQLVMACGTGKTLIGLWVFEELRCERALVLVPSLSLLAQTLREWTSNAASPISWLAVCSDPSVEQDDLVEHTSELGFPTTTDPAAIADVLNGAGSGVVFATYQSSQRIAEAFELGAPAFDLAIADEAHRCSGMSGSSFATIVDEEAIHARRRLFMTATPRYFTARVRRAAEGADLEVASMDDEVRFGPVFHRLSFGEAIERGLLSDYQVLIVGVDDIMCAAQAERAALVSAEGLGVTDARSLATQIGLAKAMHEYDLRRLVSFHNRVSAARTFAERLPDTIAWMPEEERPTGTMWAEHVSGAMAAGKRETLLRRLRDIEAGARGLLANARCLGEGVDVPAIDGIAFIDPRRSMIDVIQAVGRAMRRSDDKVIGTIVLPVFVETGADPEVVLTSGPFQAVWEVLRALRAHDDTLAEALDDIRRQLGRLNAVPFDLPQRIRVDLPASVGEEFARAFRVQVVERATATWEQWFGTLEAFVEREGHSSVPNAAIVDGVRLGAWVGNQRVARNKGTLSAARIERFERLPRWTWDVLEADWEESFSVLENYARRHGTAAVRQHQIEDGHRLGWWIGTQRQAYRQGTLDTERAERLRSLPGWSWHAIDDTWDEGFRHLEEFVTREGLAMVPVEFADHDGYRLGQWTAVQRRRHALGKLNAERVRRLEEQPGWVWHMVAARQQQAMMHLQTFVAREGHARVPVAHVESDFPLGAWASERRKAFREGKLDAALISQLEELAGWTWDQQIARWEEGFARLREYVGRNETARAPKATSRVTSPWECGWQRRGGPSTVPVYRQSVADYLRPYQGGRGALVPGASKLRRPTKRGMGKCLSRELHLSDAEEHCLLACWRPRCLHMSWQRSVCTSRQASMSMAVLSPRR